MRIILTGGGTGGHITPTLVVAHELKKIQPDCKITYVIERKAKFGDLVTSDDAIDEVRYIFAGKLRRYHGESWARRLSDVKTILLNFRDVIYLSLGFIQSVWLIARLKPSVVFVKGGYVGLPVGAASAIWHCPIVTHDSDTMPGLTNRIVARWARVMATAFPAELYKYPTSRVRYIGVPVSESFSFTSENDKQALKVKLGIPAEAQVLFVTGGSLGAVRLNQAVADITPMLLNKYPKLYIIHQTGSKSGPDLHEASEYGNRLVVKSFVKPLSDYSGAADIVVARPGATTMAELAAQNKACIVVASPFLAEGHQLKNAAHLAEEEAAISLNEGKNLSGDLKKAIEDWLNDPKEAKRTANKLHKLLRPDAAHELAMILLKQAKNKVPGSIKK